VPAERTTVDLVAGHKSSGEPVFEQVLVDRLDDGTYRIIATPGLVLGIAADDVVRVTPDSQYELVERGRNLAVQVYGNHDLVDEVTKDVWELGGALDGRADNLTVYTIPVTAGFPKVEQVFNDLVGRHPEVEWYFGNVYDNVDGVTPLNWWQ
jgi:Domain of unknown function (DUF4265)